MHETNAVVLRLTECELVSRSLPGQHRGPGEAVYVSRSEGVEHGAYPIRIRTFNLRRWRKQ